MAKQDIVVVGASAGGVEVLQTLVAGLPADYAGSLFIVLHIPPRSRSALPSLLNRQGQLHASHPFDGERIVPGRIYVAPPDRHLVLEDDRICLGAGPKEQHHRPCINVLFRSAAEIYGERVAAVLLTGELDDGTGGLWEIKRKGGVSIVQNPETASFPSMPLSALREIEADYVLPVGEIADLLVRLSTSEGKVRQKIRNEEQAPVLTDLTCPDCSGTMWEVSHGKGIEFRCRVGHTFSPLTMLSEHFAGQETAIYRAIVALEEGASLVERIAGHFALEMRTRLEKEAEERRTEAANLRRILAQRTVFALDFDGQSYPAARAALGED